MDFVDKPITFKLKVTTFLYDWEQGYCFHLIISEDPGNQNFTVRFSITVVKGPGKRGHIVANTLLPTQMFPRLPARNICCGHRFCVRDTKNVSDFVQKHFSPQQMFPSLRSMETQHSFCVPRAQETSWATKCVRNNVSSFARAFRFDTDCQYRTSLLGQNVLSYEMNLTVR